ncbi:MAG: tRNA (adenosine(37)-N6)-threonylcarbamoyltransferase complex transferase subunit TsaD [Deltaproteobacteria bacterium]|nr:tRNA (adenosine(37)-N6)-threonylcarbamoyltransferase complex transferase subunit TsaD [Deltaproteobacteria bacterium]
MLILGIESSCDDMAAAVVRDGRFILSSVVSSQDAIHHKYGGIVPELASRRHLETVIPVVEEALNHAKVTLDDIDAIGVTQGPGLVGSILVGLSFAKAVSYVKDIPFVGVNHITAHPMAVFLEAESKSQRVKESERKSKNELAPCPLPLAPAFPFIALVVSGGHTTLFKFKNFGDYEILGQTRDDAAGEAFDKVAKLMGLGYPGGAVIDRLAREGNASAIDFTRPYIAKDTYDFSFSGIKTAALHWIKGQGSGVKGQGENKLAPCPLPLAPVLNDLAASFQEAVVDVLVDKAITACMVHAIDNLVVCGGVACNSRLREKMRIKSKDNGIKLFIPEPSLCSDNGAMIAGFAYQLRKQGVRGSLDMNAMPSMGNGH